MTALVWVFCVIFCYMVLSYKIWSVLHANEQGETGNATRTTTDLIQQLSKLISFDSWLHTLTSETVWERERERERERDCWKPLIKTHSVIQISTFVFVVIAGGMSICVRGVLICIKNMALSAHLWLLVKVDTVHVAHVDVSCMGCTCRCMGHTFSAYASVQCKIEAHVCCFSSACR